MKKLISIILLFSLSATTVVAHCGSCGVGGSADDHAESEDKSHHDGDEKYEEAAERKAELLNEDSDEDDSEE